MHYTHTHTHTHTHRYIHTHTPMEYYLATQRMTFAICSNLDGLGGHYAQWNKSEKGNTVWHHFYAESSKYNRLVNTTKKKQTHKYGEKLVKKLVFTSGERVGMRANIWVGNSEVQTILYEISYKDILYNVGNITNAAAAAAAKLLQLRPTLCDPIDGSPPGSPVPGILRARTPEWVAISFSSAWKWKVKVK